MIIYRYSIYIFWHEYEIWISCFYFITFDQNKLFSYTYISTTPNPIDMMQSAVYLSYLVLNSSYFCGLSHDVFVKLSNPHFVHFFLHGAGHEIQISYSCKRYTLNICILSNLYSSYSLELGEDIELSCVVQDFCLVTVNQLNECWCKCVYITWDRVQFVPQAKVPP